MLYPIVTESRSLVDLSGIWKFKIDDGRGFSERWQEIGLKGKTYNLPVPASYNELVTDIEEREHVGYIWYEKEFYIPAKLLNEDRIVLRFGSATHSASVYMNGKEIGKHFGGFLPFEMEIKDILVSGSNRITVALDNALNENTLPISDTEVRTYTIDGKKKNFLRHGGQRYGVDFYNFSGIHRPVKIYTTPKIYIEDIQIITAINRDDGVINFNIKTNENCEVRCTVLDENKKSIISAVGMEGECIIKKAKLWEPGNAYLYELKVELIQGKEVIDIYYESFGIRTVEVREDRFFINGKPFYFKGFSKHEDSHFHGRGLDETLNVKDFSLMKWIGANSFRTSHYPYSEEMMRLADQEGIVIIDEVPAVGLSFNFSWAYYNEEPVPAGEETWNRITVFEDHKKALLDLVARDKNHPAVVMWSIANQPTVQEKGSFQYFKPLFDVVRKTDPQKRPLTMAFAQSPNGFREVSEDAGQVFSELDVLCFNVYYGWYIGMGDVHLVKETIVEELHRLYNTFKKPMMYTEFGTDTIAGFHEVVPTAFSEEYQSLFYKVYGEAFDECQHFIGEQPWNFADFATDQYVKRPGGNKKGLFTRERKPKLAAHTLRERWHNIPNFNYK